MWLRVWRRGAACCWWSPPPASPCFLLLQVVLHLMNHHIELTKQPFDLSKLPQDLVAAYRAVFEQHYQCLSTAEKHMVQQLLQVGGWGGGRGAHGAAAATGGVGGRGGMWCSSFFRCAW